MVKKAVWHTSVLFMGTPNSLFSTPRISITTGLIFVKLKYLPYMRPYIPNLKEISPVVCEICVPENCPIFFTFFFFFALFYKSTLSHQSHSSRRSISFKFGTPIRHFVAYCSLNLKMFKLNLKELWMIISLKNVQNL